MARDWTRLEVETLVADYLAMLGSELRGERYSKTDHRRALSPLLSQRTDSSIERKHQNVSAILIELGYPSIAGYKPLSNYQSLLFDVVADRVPVDASLAASVRASVEAPAPLANVADLLSRMESPPEAAERLRYSQARERGTAARPGINWLEQEARNQSLGLAGEEFVVQFERTRLQRSGRERLAARVEHVAVTVGDGEGFDIRSFEVNGSDRLIEVKTTAYGKQIPFFLSRHELVVSRRQAHAYSLYRLFRFRDDPRLYRLAGALDETCILDPVQFSARVR